MNSRIKRVVTTATLVTAICLTASLANAERAQFDLPFEARWGSTILHPGTYTFDIPSATLWPQQINLNKNGSTVWILPIAESTGLGSNHSYLKLVAVRGTYFIREYDSGQTGKQFTFGIPKDPSHELKIKPAIEVTKIR